MRTDMERVSNQENLTEGQSVCQPAVRAVIQERGISFGEAVELAKRQINIAWFARPPFGKAGADYRLAEALCRIMAEVMKMRDMGQIRISGEMLESSLVKDVFAEIRAEHVERVIEAIRTQGCGDTCKKIYIRTMLYNSVFELACEEQAGVDRGLFD